MPMRVRILRLGRATVPSGIERGELEDPFAMRRVWTIRDGQLAEEWLVIRHEGGKRYSYALRHVDIDAVVPALISALDDADQEVRYNAVAGLASFTSKTGEWFPAYPVFIKNQTFYIGLWKNWWETRGKNRMGKLKGRSES